MNLILNGFGDSGEIEQAGYNDTRDAIANAPWTSESDPHEGVVPHEHESHQTEDSWLV